MPRVPSAYDITITQGPTTRGYLLARQGSLGRGARRWSVEAVAASIAQRTPAEAQYGNQAAIIELPMVFRSTHKGYGDARVVADDRYHYSVSVDGRFPHQVIAGPAVNPFQTYMGANCVGFFEQDGMLFAIGGRHCVSIETDGTVGVAQDFGAGKVATDCGVFGWGAPAAAYGYVGMGYAEPFWERAANANPALGWTQAAALYMGQISVFKDRLWASTTAHEVQPVATAPKTATNWGARYGIGDPGKSITELAELADLLYVGKTNGLFALDSSGLGQMATPELGRAVAAANCVQMGAWHGSMWVPHERGLFNYRSMGAQGFLVTPATPGAFAVEDNPIKGKITALVGDDRWLYVALYTAGADTYILAGRQSMGDEQAFGPMIWHPLAHLASMKVEAMHISGLWGNPRLFFAYGANDMAYIILPRKGENPISDTAYRYATSGSIYYPAHCSLSPTTTKIYKSIQIGGSKLTATRYADVYYRIDEGPWLLAGRANRSPRDIVILPAAGVSGLEMEIRLDLTLPDATETPRIYSVVVRCVERPPSIKVFTVAVRCADGMMRNNNTRERRTGAEILLELEGLAQLDEAVLLRDTIGIERWVLILPPIGEVETVQRDSQIPEKVAMVKMVLFEAEARPGIGGGFIIGSLVGGTDVII